MKDTAYAFSVSAVRVRENGLLKRAQLEALASAPDEAAALRLLEDYGYSGITSDPEAALSEKLRLMTEFIMEISPDRELLRFLFVKNDFHNLKAAMKCSVSGVSPEGYFLPAVTAGTDLIEKVVAEHRYTELPEMLSAPAESAWDALVTGMNGQLCEMILDRAAIEASVKVAKLSGDDFSTGLAELRRKLSAVMIAYRCAAAEKNPDFIKAALPDCPYPSRDALISAALAGCGEVISLAGSSGIPLEEGSGASDIWSASGFLEEEYLEKSAYVSMGPAPVVSYYLRTEREISQVRVILTCKRCGFSDEVIRKKTGIFA